MCDVFTARDWVLDFSTLECAVQKFNSLISEAPQLAGVVGHQLNG